MGKKMKEEDLGGKNLSGERIKEENYKKKTGEKAAILFVGEKNEFQKVTSLLR